MSYRWYGENKALKLQEISGKKLLIGTGISQGRCLLLMLVAPLHSFFWLLLFCFRQGLSP